jgi:thiamine kinase
MNVGIGPLLASGSSSEVYALDADRVLKLYHLGAEPDAPRREAAISAMVREAGAPAPAAIGVTELDGRVGVVFERSPGPTMLEAIGMEPDTVDEQARRLAKLQAELHVRAGTGLAAQRERFEARIARLTGLAHPLRAGILQALERLPAGNGLCHGDFHPGNVIMVESGACIIDWVDATCGAPAADAACTSLLLQYAGKPSHEPALRALRQRFHAVWFGHYCELSGLSPADIDAWTLPVAAARLAYTRSASELDLLARLIRQRLPLVPQ